MPSPDNAGAGALTGRLAVCNHGLIGIIEGYDGEGLWKGTQLFRDKPWQSKDPRILNRRDEPILIAAAEERENE